MLGAGSGPSWPTSWWKCLSFAGSWSSSSPSASVTAGAGGGLAILIVILSVAALSFSFRACTWLAGPSWIDYANEFLKAQGHLIQHSKAFFCRPPRLNLLTTCRLQCPVIFRRFSQVTLICISSCYFLPHIDPFLIDAKMCSIILPILT